ncbi:MAG TPA: hypothetical protein VH740_27475 [Vicinamibacterales bacterium]|jgi:hypothetical protein
MKKAKIGVAVASMWLLAYFLVMCLFFGVHKEIAAAVGGGNTFTSPVFPRPGDEVKVEFKSTGLDHLRLHNHVGSVTFVSEHDSGLSSPWGHLEVIDQGDRALYYGTVEKVVPITGHRTGITTAGKPTQVVDLLEPAGDSVPTDEC